MCKLASFYGGGITYTELAAMSFSEFNDLVDNAAEIKKIHDAETAKQMSKK